MKIRQSISFFTLALTAGSVAAADIADKEQPGVGVLCVGAFVYVVEEYGRNCVADESPVIREHFAQLSDRFDAYLIRNFLDGARTLAAFKAQQVPASSKQCGNPDIASVYASMSNSPPQALDRMVDELLAQDGPPSFGDCV